MSQYPTSIASEARLQLHALNIRCEDGEYIVGRPDIGEFIGLPPVGVRIIELISQGATPRLAEEQLAAECGEVIDVTAFIEQLLEVGFIAAVDGRSVAEKASKPPNLVWLRPGHVQWLFGIPAKVVYATLVSAALVTLVLRPGLLPGYQDFFWSTTLLWVMLFNSAIFYGMIALHELAHLIAARSYGVPAWIGLGTRLANLVVQTDVTGLWSCPRYQRYRVYLAGMATDLLLAAMALLAIAWLPLPALLASLLQVVLLCGFLLVMFQVQVFMRTDLYFVLMDLLRCHNLHPESLGYLRYLAKRLVTHQKLTRFVQWRRRSQQSPSPLAALAVGDRRKIQLFSLLVLVGSAVSLGIFFRYGIPTILSLLWQAGNNTWQGWLAHNYRLLADGSVTLMIQGVIEILFVRTLWRDLWPRLAKWRSARKAETEFDNSHNS
ncbi:MAG: PqqD family protein [Cyanobacteria bacterium NC_groundwater_1444_Ag_S-0.65um_54_12]|nr:PqqD family protein [Cyanobacteria bacterium NC_groundwater_1444_Ag_S-0.65um_54_12]